MLKDIIKVQPLDKYNLRLSFEDGVERIADISQLIEFTGIFEPLKFKAYFYGVKVNPEWGTIYWENGLRSRGSLCCRYRSSYSKLSIR